MERLTFEGNFCDIAMCAEVPGGSFCEDGACSQRKVWERLKQYEDAEAEGCLVVLPCKVGDTVWVVFANGIRPYVVDRINIIAQNQLRVRMRFMCNETLYLTDNNFGKSVFLTREEAEAALKGESE